MLDRCHHVEDLENTGREAHTYLHHIQNGHGRGSTKTVFAQGDPLEHSPDFLKLLGLAEAWASPQALSCRWKKSAPVPPAYQLAHETQDHLRGCRVRREFFSLGTWGPIGFRDVGACDVSATYLSMHGLPAGWNVAGHFLELCGLETLAEAAWQAQVGRFAYGAIFGVNTEALMDLPEREVDRMLTLARAHPSYGYVMERLWLHLFGAPFIQLTALNA